MGDDPEGKRCPAFAQEDRAAEAKKAWSSFPPIPGGTWLSLLGCPCVLHPLQGMTDTLLIRCCSGSGWDAVVRWDSWGRKGSGRFSFHSHEFPDATETPLALGSFGSALKCC